MALFMLKLIIIYALILFFNISSDVRCMKIPRKKKLSAKSWGVMSPSPPGIIPPPPPPLQSHLAEKQPLLVAHYLTDCKVSKGENKVGEYEDDKEGN